MASARTLAAIVVTALLASALTVRWNDAAATGVTLVTSRQAAVVAALPVTIEGSVVGAGNGLVAVTERGAASPVAFTVGADAQLVRGGENVALDALRAGDMVQLTVDGLTGSVMRLQAEPAAAAAFSPRVP
ncbi:MAG: hypothetical protein ACRDJC_19615, partial [Thermomicrobiales bacterium]